MDQVKIDFPDPAVRQKVRANGRAVVEATVDDPRTLDAIHKLSNLEVGQAAKNAGIDVPQFVGSRKGLQGQVSRQELLDQMIAKGVKPQDIPGLAKPPGPGGLRAFDVGELKEGDTFVDVHGEPRRIVEIAGDEIHTADGTAKTYHGEVNALSDLNSPTAQLARGGKFIPDPDLPNMPAKLGKYLEPDEKEFLRGRSVMQRNVAKAYDNLAPTMDEMKNLARAGHGLGGWWQRFIDAFEAMGERTTAEQMRASEVDPAEMLKATHSALSGNKAVQQANKIAWGAIRDWLEAGKPTDIRSISKIIKANRGISGTRGLDSQKFFKLVNSPQFQEGEAFHGQAFVGSPVPGVSSGAKKIPSMVATTAGKGNLRRIVFDTHMRSVYGLNGLTDSQYLAASIHIRQVAEGMELQGGEAQEQMWGTVLGLKQLMKSGLGPRQAAQAYGKDVLAGIGKDYAQIILDSMNDPKVREALEDLKKFGFDPGGPVASQQLREIAEEGARRMAERARPIRRGLLERSARRIQATKASKEE